MNFQKIYWEGLTEPFPRPLPSILGFAFDSGFDLNTRALRALGSGLAFYSPPICSIISHQPRGTEWNICAPATSSSLLRHCVLKYITQYRLSVVELSKGEVGGWPKNFISWVYILTKIVGLEGWGGGIQPPVNLNPADCHISLGGLGPPIFQTSRRLWLWWLILVTMVTIFYFHLLFLLHAQ